MAQEVRGHFESHRTSIGEITPYSLTVRYPRAQQVLFPDSTFSFAPFDIRGKKFFTTKTIGDNSYDSVVYFLTTFEIDSVQRLRLPVFFVHERDCVAVFPRPDSVLLNYRVASVPDSVTTEQLPLKTNTAYQNVKWILNYPLYAIIGGVLVLALIIVWIVFGKRIRKYFVLRRLQKEYTAFLVRFNGAIDKLSVGFSSRSAEEALLVWKLYMEDLEKNPYTKYTSREIVHLIHDPHLDSALRSIDRGIYGGQVSPVDSFRFLQSFSGQRFQQKEAEVKNG
jgi:hypothetical protein